MQQPPKTSRRDAILLVGPTGAGKTPLGLQAEADGFQGRHCAHFDFGQQLRMATAGGTPLPGLSENDIYFIKQVLSSGALLENETFGIAETILNTYIASNAAAPTDIVILNGLPRHIGQAERLAPLLNVIRVIHLRGSADVIYERIRLNSGGDRSGRTDDTPEDIRKKLDLFEQRTAPLIAFYRQHDIPIVEREVELHSNPQNLWCCVNKQLDRKQHFVSYR